MKIAVPYEDGKVFQHFGRAREIKLYTVESGMELYAGVIARADDAVNAFLSNNLAYDPEVGCHEFDDDPNHTCQG